MHYPSIISTPRPSPPTDMVLFNFSGILTSVQEDEAVCGREAFNTQRGRKEVDVVGGAVRMISNVLGHSEQRRGPSRCWESVRTMKRWESVRTTSSALRRNEWWMMELYNLVMENERWTKIDGIMIDVSGGASIILVVVGWRAFGWWWWCSGRAAGSFGLGVFYWLNHRPNESATSSFFHPFIFFSSLILFLRWFSSFFHHFINFSSIYPFFIFLSVFHHLIHLFGHHFHLFVIILPSLALKQKQIIARRWLFQKQHTNFAHDWSLVLLSNRENMDLLS